ncbi:MAG: hypothetical protein H7287_06380 [Thermoleophilia bacterium]|nr:hypothetical protein [Thermoleophilia bacterium]
MPHHAVHDQVASLYADGVDQVWASWEPSLRRCEQLLGSADHRQRCHTDDLAQHFRHAQYHAHIAGELAVGLVPPKQSAHPHDQLVGVLGMCRDTLSVIAVRAELDELDDETALIGLLAIDSTRDAFRGARVTSTDLQAWITATSPVAPWVMPQTPPSTFMTLLMWSLIGVCGVLFLALVAEVFLMGN